MNRTTNLLVAALLAAMILPPEMLAQSSNVRPRNKNQSVKFKSGIFRGSGNLIESNAVTSSIGGGQSNAITSGADYAVVGGGFGNVVSNNFGTVGGGYTNRASGDYATVSGGAFNAASGDSATVSGGVGNAASGDSATVGGGAFNAASDYAATVGGGYTNRASGRYATVGGGYTNAASGVSATVGGGFGNTASGTYATVPGGARASATHFGSFVWSGDNDFETTSSFGDETFTVRCEGGARFYSADGTGTGPRFGPGGTDWIATSDSNLKTKVTAVNAREILEKLSRLPVTEWEYKHRPDRRYIGPMSQDFHAIFGLGDDDKGIGTLDSDGVMYAAIQGLVEELKERDKKIDKLENELRAIREQLSNLPPQ